MNKNQGSISITRDMKDAARSKSLTPAVLGVANSHGVKLSLNMTSEDKKELLTQLEEWRKARRERLAASILAKQKQIEKTKVPVIQVSTKSKPISGGDVDNSKIPCRQSVFDRLYKNNGKVKKPEVATCSSKPLVHSKKATPLPSENSNKPVKVLLVEKEKEVFHTGISEDNLPLDSVVAKEENRRQADENSSLKMHEGQCNINKKAMKPSLLIKDQSKINESKQDKAFKCSTSVAPARVTEPEKRKNPLRRSISMMFRQKRCTDFTVRRSASARNLHEISSKKLPPDCASLQTLIQPAVNSSKGNKNEATAKSVSFVTPLNNKSLTSIHLRTNLEKWLKGNGHPLEGYRHLRCFDMTCNKREDFPKSPAVSSNSAIENPCFATTPSTPVDDSDKENETPPTVMQQTDASDTENWLKELHRLIVELKYPSERCEEWLIAIRNKCASCTQLPIYWECLAAIHESKGDLKSAIENYEKAIINGIEVDVVGDSLAQLFDKMVIEQKKNTKRKLEKGLDPKNIFKSTIIKFALQQKALKNQSSEVEPGVRQRMYVATPVRRSTRIQTPYKSTEEVASLQTLTPELRKSVTFQPNESLLHGD